MPTTQSQVRELHGKWVVAGMFAFAITLIAILWGYWKLHTAPFLPLQLAIAEQFPGSAPQVQGGQRKMHELTPRILRVTMKVEFNPLDDEDAATRHAKRVAEFVTTRQDLSQFGVLEIHFFYLEPEREIRQWSMEMKIGATGMGGPE